MISKHVILPLVCSAAIVVALTTGCQQGGEIEESTDPSSSESDPLSESNGEARFLGMEWKKAEALAKELGHSSRVTKIDGEPKPVTMDYRPERLNFEIEGGEVVKVTRG